jgi:hypothetical protein
MPEELVRMLSYKRREETERIGSDLAEKPFSEFQLFRAIGADEELSSAFSKMQEIYVFSQNDVLSRAQLSVYMTALNQTLLTLDEGLTMASGLGPTQQML